VFRRRMHVDVAVRQDGTHCGGCCRELHCYVRVTIRWRCGSLERRVSGNSRLVVLAQSCPLTRASGFVMASAFRGGAQTRNWQSSQATTLSFIVLQHLRRPQPRLPLTRVISRAHIHRYSDQLSYRQPTKDAPIYPNMAARAQQGQRPGGSRFAQFKLVLLGMLLRYLGYGRDTSLTPSR
jgi:hypothetical protein